MFGNFKEKIHNVQHDLSLGWRNFADKAKSVNKKIARKATLLSDGDGVEREDQCYVCDLEAGGDILKKYQLDWIELHNESVGNAQKSVEADKIILDVWKKCQLVNDTVSSLYSELSILPNLTAQLEVVKSDMAALSTQMDILEDLMIELEDVCENQEIERKKALHKARINNLKESVKVEYQEQKAHLEQQRMLACEEKLKLDRQASVERQHIFEDAFLKQMEYYSQFGITEKPIVEPSQAECSLADISIDNDSDLYHEYMDFLGPETQEIEAPLEESSDQESDNNIGDNQKAEIETAHDSHDPETQNETDTIKENDEIIENCEDSKSELLPSTNESLQDTASTKESEGS